MAAYTGISKNFHSVEDITQDLLADLPKDLSPKALGVLICDSQLNATQLLQKLGSSLPFPIVGGTTFTYPLWDNNNEISATITVLEKEDMCYSIAVTPTLEEASCQEQMQTVYQQCIQVLPEAPKLLIPFFPLIPGLTTDKFINSLFSIAQEIPVFGGVTTDDLDTTKAAVFTNGEVYTHSMVLVALSGAIQPVFSVGSQLTVLSEYGPAVTESDNNIVHRVDDMTFCEYMRGIGIAPEQRVNGVDALVQYGPLPCQLRYKLKDDDGVPEIRCISYTNVEEGSVAFSSALPLGTRVHMGIIQKNDVVESSTKCLNGLLEKMKLHEDQGYRYSTLFSVPCVARYFAMLGGENLERNLLSKEMPKNLAVSTYYGFCEIGPTQSKDGEVHNRSHNASIVMCAI